jgi:hypothetical protein
MAYQNGTATSPVDLLQKLVAFAQDAGWTVNASEAVNAHWKAHLSSGAVNANLFANIGITAGYSPWGYNPVTPAWTAAAGCIHLYCSDGYDGGVAWNAQPGRPLSGTYTAGSLAPLAASDTMSYWFFGTERYIHANVQLSGGANANFGFGTLEKVGAYTGGAYFFGNAAPRCYGTFANAVTAKAQCPFFNGIVNYQPTSYVRVDFDGNTGLWTSNYGETTTSDYVDTGVKHLCSVTSNAIIPNTSAMATFQMSSLTLQPTLLPLHLFVRRSSVPLAFSLLGKVPDVYALLSAYTSGTEVEIGDDTYVVFASNSTSIGGWAARKVA